MQIVLNMDSKRYATKPKQYAGAISNRTRNERGIRVLEDPDELIDAIRQGITFTPSQIGGTLEQQQERDAEGNKVYKNLEPFWISQQIIAVDIDNETPQKEQIELPLSVADAIQICQDNNIEPYAIYTTFTHADAWARFRVLWVLDKPITDFKTAYDYIGRAAHMFNAYTAGKYEEQGKKAQQSADTTIEPVKLIFGSTPNCIVYAEKHISTAEQFDALPTGAREMPINKQGNNNLHDLADRQRNAQSGANNADLLDALWAIDPAQLSDDEWISIAAACKTEGISYADFDAWSSTDTGINDEKQPRYNEEQNYIRWNSLSGTGAHGKATARTIYKIAERFGYKRQSGKYSFDDTIDANGNIIKHLEEQQAALNEIDAREHNAGAQVAAPDDEAADPGTDPAQEQKAKPSFFMSATEYLHAGTYDAEMEYMRKFAGRRMGLHTGIDKHLTLYPGLAALGGQASLGKTTFAVNMVHKLLERGEHVLYFAFEQTRAEIFTKSIARQVYIDKPNALITNIDIKNGSQSKIVQKARRELETSGLFYNIVECDFNWTVADIKEVVKQYMHLYPGIKPVVIIDYLQLIAPPVNFRGSIREYTDENLKQLKGFQKDNGLFIVLISSFNRSSYLDPVSYDSFKETGMIESTCDYVWGLQLSILDPSNTNFYYRIGEKGGLYERTKAEKLQMIQRAQRDFPKQVQFVSLKSRAGKQSYKADFLYYPAYDFFKPNIYGITELPEYDPAQQEADDEQNTTPAQPVIIAPPR